MHNRSVSKEVTHHIIEVSHNEDLRSDHLDAYSEMPKSKRARRTASLALLTINSNPNPESPVMSDTLTQRALQKDYSNDHGPYTHPYNRCLERRNHSGSNSLSISRKEQLVERETEAQNQADIASARFRANYQRQNDRPYNTKVNYGLKHRAWKDWCGDRKFQDLDTVTDGKLLLWLQEIVIPRGNQSAGNKKGLMLSKSGLEGYVKPIIDLYEV